MGDSVCPASDGDRGFGQARKAAEMGSEPIQGSSAACGGGLVGRAFLTLGGGEGHWLERMMSPTQLDGFRRTQALMSLLEEYIAREVDERAGQAVIAVTRTGSLAATVTVDYGTAIDTATPGATPAG